MKENHKTYIMQQNDHMSPAFTLQECTDLQSAKETVFRLMMRRAMKMQLWPVWIINGIKY